MTKQTLEQKLGIYTKVILGGIKSLQYIFHEETPICYEKELTPGEKVRYYNLKTGE